MASRPAMLALLLMALGAAGCHGDADALRGRLQRFKDAMCACKDRACAQQVADELVDWSLQNAHELSLVRATDGARATLTDLGRCQDERLRLQ